MVRGLYSGGSDDYVYFEKQASTGRFCGLHCLNNLLQGSVFTREELDQIGAAFDRAERRLGGGADYQHASADGFYGVEVMAAALQSKGYRMAHIRSSEYKDLHACPAKFSDGFILNLRQHWLSIRTVKGRWFSFDSLRAPEAISESSINGFVTTLEQQDYTVFVVRHEKWPATRLPEPQRGGQTLYDSPPSPYPGSAYLTFKAASNMYEKAFSGGPSLPSAGTTAPVAARAPPVHEWPTDGGNRLGGAPAAASQRTEEDPELLECIKLSILEFKKGLPPLPVEPETDYVTFKVLDNGASYTRRFSRTQATVEDLFHWIFKDDGIGSTCPIALGAASEVTLTAQYPRRTITRTGAGKLTLGGQFDYQGTPSSSTLLSQLFPDGGDTIKVSFQ